MAKAILLLSALCVLAIANFAVADFEIFDVEGKVFCDTCRLGFVTSLSDTIEGATVSLACSDIETNNVTFITEGKTDYIGKYTLTVEGDHENDICEVKLVNSPKEDCKKIVPELVYNRIVCSKNVGMHNAVRFVNPLFFKKTNLSMDAKNLLRKWSLLTS